MEYLSPDRAYVVALALTLAIEAPLVAAGLARWYGVSPGRGVALGLAGSLFTHPVVWFVLAPALIPKVGYLGYLLVAEGFAWLAEGLLYRAVVRRDLLGLLILSLLANLASFLAGALLGQPA